MQLRRIIAGALGLVMVGATLGFAATLGDYPSPFVSEGEMNSLIVVGSDALPSDVVGAIDIAARLGGETTEEVTIPGTGAAVTITGEGKAIATANTKIYLGDSLRKTGARYTMTESDLPTTLASGTLQDSDAGTSYNYDLYIELSDDYNVKFAQHVPSTATTLDPALVYKHGTGASPSTPSSTNYLYKTKIVFEKDVNGTTAAGEELTLFGTKYTISTSTDFTASTPKLVLYGSADTRVLTAQEPVTVTIGGVDYDVELVGVTSTTAAVLKVGTDTKSVTRGNTYTVGGLQVYIDDVYYLSSTDQTQNMAKVSLGAETITFEDEKKVYKGTSTITYIDGTLANLTVSGGKLSMLEVYVVPEKTTIDVAKVGEKFQDPIFGTFYLAFESATPDLTDASRSVLTIKASGDDSLTVTFTDDRGNEKTFTWAYDADSIDLEDSAGYKYHVKEGENIYQNEYLLVDAGDYTHLLQLTDLDNDGTSTSSVELTDIFTGTRHLYTLGTDNRTVAYIDGQAYYIDGGQPGHPTYVVITWGDGADYNDVGDQLTVYPRLKGKNGEYIALMNETTPIDVEAYDGKYIDLPTGRVLITYDDADSNSIKLNLSAYTGYTVTYTNGWNLSDSNAGTRALYVGKTSTGGFYYNLTRKSNETITITPAGSDAVANTQEAIILVEEEDKDGNIYSVQVEAANETSGSIIQIIAGTPDFTHTEQSASLKTNTYKTQYVDFYGVFAERDTYGQDSVVIYYPDEQMTMDFYILGPDGAVSTTEGTAATTVEQAVPIKTAVGKLDTEADALKATTNLILVGGPCVNDLVAELAAAGKFDYTCDAWPGENFGVIKLIEDAFAEGYTALVVAGTRAEDTRDATAILQAYDDYATELADKTTVKVVGTTVTELA